MPLRLSPFADVGLTAALVDHLLDRHRRLTLPRLELFWTYYRNPVELSPAACIADAVGGVSSAASLRSSRIYRQGQQRGLPPRITSPRAGLGPSGSSLLPDDRAPIARDPVIENDIAWRIHSMVDFMFGRPIKIRSIARDHALRSTIDTVLDAVFEASGGITLLQDAALLGHVYGHVDLLLRQVEPLPHRRGGDRTAPDPDHLARTAAEAMRIELVEPTRGVPLTSPDDFRSLDAYLLTYTRGNPAPTATDGARDAAPPQTQHTPRGRDGRSPPSVPPPPPPPTRVLEIFSPTHRQRYEDTGGGASGAGPRLVEEAPNRLTPGVLPLVHIQNIAQPFDYPGLSEVEPLIPLQDELNTRLSDRAARVTFQSFKMYLAKGIDGFDRTPVAPGQVWSTDNPDASVTSFGGDAASPSEDRHIDELREALDKISGVPPLATGVVRAKIGNLSSENALRVTLLGLLSKTERKRVTYGRAIGSLARLILTALDESGLFPTDPADRNIRIDWPNPLPLDERELVQSALDKAELGVPKARLIDELGYQPGDPGVI
jgi:hypothetical protein